MEAKDGTAMKAKIISGGFGSNTRVILINDDGAELDISNLVYEVSVRIVPLGIAQAKIGLNMPIVEVLADDPEISDEDWAVLENLR
jgi:hypothetical protein